jgi:hypothetical protein
MIWNQPLNDKGWCHTAIVPPAPRGGLVHSQGGCRAWSGPGAELRKEGPMATASRVRETTVPSKYYTPKPDQSTPIESGCRPISRCIEDLRQHIHCHLRNRLAPRRRSSPPARSVTSPATVRERGQARERNQNCLLNVLTRFGPVSAPLCFAESSTIIAVASRKSKMSPDRAKPLLARCRSGLCSAWAAPWLSPPSTRLVAVILKAIAGHRVGDRPGRVEPRATKRRPKKPRYLNEPRREARKRLMASA